MGRLEEAASVKVFLQRGDRVYAVAVGDVLDNQYRVDRIDATQLTLVYLPLNVPQSLAFGKS
jgi:Tfp pilus assembly protein PilP